MRRWWPPISPPTSSSRPQRQLPACIVSPVFLDDGQRQIQSFIFRSLPGTSGDSYSGSINGGQNFSHDVYVEGISIGRADLMGSTAEFTPTVDMVNEFRLQTGVIGAQYG